MPLYEYKCNACKKAVELLLLNSKEKPLCKHCGSKDMTKLLSTFNAGEGSKTTTDTPACPTGICNLHQR